MATVQLSLQECREGGLPDICAQCGARATNFNVRQFSRSPRWVFLLLPLGVFPYLIAALLTAQRRLVNVPFCTRHRDHWVNRALLIATVLGPTIFLIVCLLGGVFEIDPPEDNPGLLGSLLALTLFFGLIGVVVVVSATTIQPAEITERTIILKNVAQAFVDAVEDLREENKVLNLDRSIQDRWRGSARDRERDDREHYRKHTDRERDDPPRRPRE